MRLTRSISRTTLLLLLLAGSLSAAGASPPPLVPDVDYVSDDLIVEFYVDPTEHDLEIFQVKYRLELDRRFPSARPSYLFGILDGLDARLKQRFVADDPSVCRVTLNWLGQFFATEPERPFGRCEGDDVGLPWPDPSSTPPLQPTAPPSVVETPATPSTTSSAGALPSNTWPTTGPTPTTGTPVDQPALAGLRLEVWLAVVVGVVLLVATLGWGVLTRRRTPG
jgi:hypothetical protein